MGTNPIEPDPDPRWTAEVNEWAQQMLDAILVGEGKPLSYGTTRRILLELGTVALIVGSALQSEPRLSTLLSLLALGPIFLLLAGER